MSLGQKEIKKNYKIIIRRKITENKIKNKRSKIIKRKEEHKQIKHRLARNRKENMKMQNENTAQQTIIIIKIKI